MKKIEVLIRPLRLEQVTDALEKIGLNVFTVTELKGFGEIPQQVELSKETQYVIDFLPKVKIEMVLEENMLEAAIDAIKKSAFTSDVSILVFDVEKSIVFSAE